MIFTLEAVQADYGDCLILYYGKKTSPKVIVIDGGPKDIYANFLKPRLLAVKNKLSPAKALPLSMVMVSHMDEDHVLGVLDLTEDMISRNGNNQQPEFDVKNFWFNSFDDIIGNIQIPTVSSIAASVNAASISSIPGLKNAERPISAVIASTGQGRQLRDNSTTLTIPVNNPFKATNKLAKLVRGDGKNSVVNWDTDLKITVVHPNAGRLEKLQTQWDKDLKKALAKGDNSIIIASITKPDTSPFNLSSIVCLVESGTKKILLTGDARADDIVEGLKLNKLLTNGKLHVDILKMPHHGSIRNADADFFKTVTADHYVISANGKFDNPDKPLLELMGDNISKGTLHLTNQTGEKNLKKKLDAFAKKLKNDGSKLKLDFRKSTAPSIVLDLDDKINF
jgi:hypothetical protein